MHKIKFLLMTTIALLWSGLLCAAVTPVAEYWDYWDKSDESSYKTINHTDWDRLLRRYVVVQPNAGIRSFRYAEVSAADKKALSGYIDSLSRIDPRKYRKLEQQAYWMNLYNALSVTVVLDNLADLTSKPDAVALPDAVKKQKQVKVAGKMLSLNDIEHRILRPLWQDHRIHFGLNCASMDCPNMDSRAYTANTIKQQLKSSGVGFINDDRGLKYADGVLTVSRLFGDYRHDFADDNKTLMKLFAHYAQDMKALYVLGYQGRINYSQNSRLNSP